MAGGQQIAAPDGGLAQQRDGKQRMGRLPLPLQERVEAGEADGQKRTEHEHPRP